VVVVPAGGFSSVFEILGNFAQTDTLTSSWMDRASLSTPMQSFCGLQCMCMIMFLHTVEFKVIRECILGTLWYKWVIVGLRIYKIKQRSFVQILARSEGEELSRKKKRLREDKRTNRDILSTLAQEPSIREAKR
jgi:hypothetical protein